MEHSPRDKKRMATYQKLAGGKVRLIMSTSSRTNFMPLDSLIESRLRCLIAQPNVKLFK